MRIEGEDYTVWYNSSLHIAYFEGVLRLRDSRDYSKIREFLFDICELGNETLTCDFMKLNFLNSAGISTICKFVIDQKTREKIGLRFICNKDLLWQTKSFPVLRMVWENLEIEWNSRPLM
jgi:hypothetical protein